MHQSHFIEIRGTLIGGAITSQAGYRFRAVHPMVQPLDGAEWPTLDALRSAAGGLFAASRGGVGSAGEPGRQAELTA